MKLLLINYRKMMKKPIMIWLRKIGLWGFIFFLVKGIVWMLIGYFMIK